MTALVGLLIALPAAWWDVRARRVPNWLTAGGLAAALVLRAAEGTMGAGLAGALYLGVPFLLLWCLFGGVGAGDVKLAAALGAALGPCVGRDAVLAGLLAALAWALVVRMASRDKAPLPLAPFLAGGVVFAVLQGACQERGWL